MLTLTHCSSLSAGRRLCHSPSSLLLLHQFSSNPVTPTTNVQLSLGTYEQTPYGLHSVTVTAGGTERPIKRLSILRWMEVTGRTAVTR
jgi:hypothetical protein